MIHRFVLGRWSPMAIFSPSSSVTSGITAPFYAAFMLHHFMLRWCQDFMEVRPLTMTTEYKGTSLTFEENNIWTYGAALYWAKPLLHHQGQHGLCLVRLATAQTKFFHLICYLHWICSTTTSTHCHLPMLYVPGSFHFKKKSIYFKLYLTFLRPKSYPWLTRKDH